ncbi:MAG: NnrS family protein [Rhodoferax sp.]|nr:NnrS family protein [Rhodoferax sp.]
MSASPLKPISVKESTRPANSQSDVPPWRPIWLLAAPHRLAFFMAALMLTTSSIWWASVLFTRSLNISLSWAIPASAAHALLMSMGFMPFFFAGFLFTAGPKWLRSPQVPARRLLPGLLLMLGGWVVALIGIHTAAQLAAAGLSLVASGWTVLSVKFFSMVRQSQESDRIHARMAATACNLGVFTFWLATASLAIDSVLILRIAVQMGLWGFIAVMFAVASHRMIPFFGASAVPFLDAWRPMWLLWAMLSMFYLEAALSVAALSVGPLPKVVQWSQAALESAFSLLLFALALRWSLVQSMKIRLLAMLHGGFVWLAIAFALSALSNTLLALTAGELSLGLAPLHAMAMGYLGTTMFAMTTRISSGHGGRAVAEDDIAWILYWILQSAVVLRVLAALWPTAGEPFTLLAIAAWSAATVGWSVRYGRWFGRARLDGRPG